MEGPDRVRRGVRRAHAERAQAPGRPGAIALRLVLDTGILIDHLRWHPGATKLVLDALRQADELCSSYVVRAEVLAGMRPGEERATHTLLAEIRWSELNEEQSETAGELGRTYRRSHPGIGVADLVVAAVALHLEADLKTLNVKHFPMFPGLRPPY
ncbi:MAG: PIN domain-containing protein [Chloroflexi bacterium]|nr:PIN domain-containing protein [Chloroflexota bacterium]